MTQQPHSPGSTLPGRDETKGVAVDDFNDRKDSRLTRTEGFVGEPAREQTDESGARSVFSGLDDLFDGPPLFLSQFDPLLGNGHYPFQSRFHGFEANSGNLNDLL